MFQILVILRRKPGLSKQEFHKHWQEVHGPLFKKFPQIKRYTQYHLSDHCRDDNDRPVDGIALLEFESLEEMREAWKMIDYEAVKTDELNFLENSGAGVHVMHVEQVVNIID